MSITMQAVYISLTEAINYQMKNMYNVMQPYTCNNALSGIPAITAEMLCKEVYWSGLRASLKPTCAVAAHVHFSESWVSW